MKTYCPFISFLYLWKKNILASFSVITLPSIDSTNAEAVRRMSKHPRLPMVIHAYEQTEGRGRQKNKWVSAPGENLTFSIVCYPSFLEASQQFFLSKAVTLSIFDLIKTCLPVNVSVKWPNDIFAGHHKIAGVLIENSISQNYLKSSVIGIGINVNQMSFPADLPHAISMKMITGIHYDIVYLRKAFMQIFEYYFAEISGTIPEVINSRYLSNLYRKDEWCSYLINGDKVQGCIRGVDAIGRLVVETQKSGTLSYAMDEIIFEL